MRLMFVYADKLGSRIIRWGLKEPVSHVAVDTQTEKGIYHSYGSGIRQVSRQDFHDDYTVYRSLYIHFPENLQAQAVAKFESYLSPHYRYDYPALGFFAFRALLRRTLRIPFPKTNRMQLIDSFLCTEVVYLVAQVYAEMSGKLILQPDDDLAMLSPWAVYHIIKGRLSV